MSSEIQKDFGTKLCPDCKLEKPLSAFSRNAARPDGQQFYCKVCYSARAARSYRERQARQGRLVRDRMPVPAGFKQCPGCREVKSHEAWHKNACSSDGLASRCRACRKAESRDSHLRRTFGMSAAEYEALVLRQGGGCAICGGPPKHVDHDHKSGAVRGVLCGPCNMGLGQFQDDPARLARAATYLRRHGLQSVVMVDEYSAAEDVVFEVACRHLSA